MALKKKSNEKAVQAKGSEGKVYAFFLYFYFFYWPLLTATPFHFHQLNN